MVQEVKHKYQGDDDEVVSMTTQTTLTYLDGWQCHSLRERTTEDDQKGKNYDFGFVEFKASLRYPKEMSCLCKFSAQGGSLSYGYRFLSHLCICGN